MKSQFKIPSHKNELHGAEFLRNSAGQDIPHHLQNQKDPYSVDKSLTGSYPELE